MSVIQGSFDPRYEAVVEDLAGNIDAGTKIGASIQLDVDGELVCRVTGVTLGADFQFGLPDSEFGRVAPVYAPVVADVDGGSLPKGDENAPDPDSVFAKTLSGSMADIDQANTDDWRRAQIGGANGHGNAKSVAQILSAVTLDGVSNGVRLLSPPTIDQIFREQANNVDMLLGIPLRWGIDFCLTPSSGVPFVHDGRVCFWGGWGGSMIVMDLDRRLTISYVMNQMQPGTIGSDVAAAYFDTIYRCFDAV